MFSVRTGSIFVWRRPRRSRSRVATSAYGGLRGFPGVGGAVGLLFCTAPMLRAESPGVTLTLPAAVTAALRHDPTLTALSHGVAAHEGTVLQAGLLPNPELRFEAENVGGSGDRTAFEETETTLSIFQVFELGGKRERRTELARSSRDVAVIEHERRRLQLAAEVARRFVAVLAAQEQLELARELEKLAGESVGAAQKQATAGALPPAEVSRTRVGLARTRAQRLTVQRDLNAVRVELAATWGAREATFTAVAGDLERLDDLPDRKTLFDRFDANPDLTRSDAEVNERVRALALAEARRVPDVIVGAGGRHFSDNGDNALVFEVDVPLPFFDRNQGGVAAARQDIAKARAEREAVAVRIRGELAAAWERLAAARERALVLRHEALPEANASLAGAREAYRTGLYRSIDVLDAQRTLFEVRSEYVQALAEFHTQATEVARLAGTRIAEEEAR